MNILYNLIDRFVETVPMNENRNKPETIAMVRYSTKLLDFGRKQSGKLMASRFVG